MKAAFLTASNTFEVRTVADPVPGPYEALCDMLYGSTCTGTDGHLIDGTFPWIGQFPTIIGHESVGRVVAIGAKVRHYAVGDLVSRVGAPAAADGSYGITWGGFASKGIARDHWAMRADGLPKAEWDGARANQIIPAGIDPAEATMIITWRETLSYLTRIGMKPGMKVLVAGTGGVGLSFCAMARNMGADDVVCMGSASRVGVATAVGATALLDYRDDGWAKAAQAIAPEGFDVVIDAVGKASGAQALAGLVRAGGTLGAYGLDDLNDYRFSPRWCRTMHIYNGGYDEEETHQEVIDWMRKGLLQARHWLPLDAPLPLEDIARAYESVRRRKAIKQLVTLS